MNRKKELQWSNGASGYFQRGSMGFMGLWWTYADGSAALGHCLLGRRCTGALSCSQRAQYPLVKEYSSNLSGLTRVELRA